MLTVSESADDDVWAGFDDEGFDMDVQAIPCSQHQSQVRLDMFNT